MLFLIRFCDDFRKILRQVDIFEQGNETVLEATRAGERRTLPFSIMLFSDIPSISIDFFVFCWSFCKKSRVFFADFVWFCEILRKKCFFCDFQRWNANFFDESFSLDHENIIFIEILAKKHCVF